MVFLVFFLLPAKTGPKPSLNYMILVVVGDDSRLLSRTRLTLTIGGWIQTFVLGIVISFLPVHWIDCSVWVLFIYWLPRALL